MAHNGFACDAPVLYWNLQRRGIDAYGWLKKVGIGSWFDSLEFARLVRGERKGNSVEELYRSEVDSTGGGLTFHDALDDCTATWDILKSAKFAADTNERPPPRAVRTTRAPRSPQNKQLSRARAVCIA
eukprot:6520334-Prymnesium_polylepis.1